MEIFKNITLYNGDCMEVLKSLPDNAYDLAIVDPPYGGGGTEKWTTKPRSRFGGHFDKYEIKATRTGGTWSEKYQGGENDIRHWDIAPSPEYFDELFRVSKNQIIWGGNYFHLPPTRCFAVWRKLTISETFSMAMCEYAWTSFDGNAKWIEIAPQGNAKLQRIHPTQKPVALYGWLLNNFAKEGDKILDTHLGSGSICIAAHDLGFEMLGIELDPVYYNAAKQRLLYHQAQLGLF